MDKFLRIGNHVATCVLIAAGLVDAWRGNYGQALVLLALCATFELMGALFGPL